jgi:integrase
MVDLTVLRAVALRVEDSCADDSGPILEAATEIEGLRVAWWRSRHAFTSPNGYGARLDRHASRSDEFRSPIVRGMARTSGKERARARILTDDEIRALLRAVEAKPGPFGAFVTFLLLTGARKSEAAQMPWDEIKDGVWLLPAARNKVKQDLARPLSGATQKLVDGLPKLGKPISSFSNLKARLDAACGVTGWTLHDLRRTARSLLSRAGIASDIAEICLGHVLPGVRGVYDRHEYHEEKKRVFEALATQIARIVDPKDNVVAMRGVL